MTSLSADGTNKGKPLTQVLWQSDGLPVLTGCGAQELLGLELTAFFASRQCSGLAIRAAMDWALQQAHAKQPVISGFQSPLEQSVLKVLLATSSPRSGGAGPPADRGPAAARMEGRTAKGAFGGGECGADCEPLDAATGPGAQRTGRSVGPQHGGGACQPGRFFGGPSNAVAPSGATSAGIGSGVRACVPAPQSVKCYFFDSSSRKTAKSWRPIWLK